MTGENLNLYWGVPFLGVLFSLSFGPIISPSLWKNHSGKILGIWSLGLMIGMMIFFGQDAFHKFFEYTKAFSSSPASLIFFLDSKTKNGLTS